MMPDRFDEYGKKRDESGTTRLPCGEHELLPLPGRRETPPQPANRPSQLLRLPPHGQPHLQPLGGSAPHPDRFRIPEEIHQGFIA